MRFGVLFGLILIAGCSEPPPLPTLQEKWAKVQSLNVEDATVDELVAKLGAPYRSDDGAKKRSRFWYPFEGVSSGKTQSHRSHAHIVILDDAGTINSFMRTEPRPAGITPNFVSSRGTIEQRSTASGRIASWQPAKSLSEGRHSIFLEGG